jgi:two-component system alkaline phosphatase synthesis response regulator PhoP
VKKIIVIDDDEDNLDVITVVLSVKGYEVIPFDHCISLESLIGLRPNLIILDNQLIGQSGGDYCQELKRNVLSQNIPVIMVSAGMDLKEIAENGSADGFLEKPFNISDLEDIVEKFAL